MHITSGGGTLWLRGAEPWPRASGTPLRFTRWRRLPGRTHPATALSSAAPQLAVVVVNPPPIGGIVPGHCVA